MRLVRVATVPLLLLLLLASAPAGAASRFLPGLKFRVLRTAHFRVYYHQREERLARTLADVAESVHASLPARLGLSAPAVTHVVLVDQDDASNGWATPLPYDTVVVTAAWPAPSSLLGNTAEWLRLVFVHEYTHVLQLHQSRGWARVARTVFGRAPFVFPNLFLPEWEVEGLATFEESLETRQGRLHGGDSGAIVRERVRLAGPEPLDAVSGGQVDWPGPLSPYLYGGFFNQYLARRFGEEKLGELARRSAGRIPYLASPVFHATFGQSLGQLWKDYQESLRRDRTRADARHDAIRLTFDGFYADTPRFVEGGRRLVYSRRTPHDLPALVVQDTHAPHANHSRAERRLATRFGGEQVGVAGRIVFYDQADYEVNVAWRSDLYAADLSSGRVQRLTRNGRLLSPDVSPDGRRLACLEIVRGVRRLVLFDVHGTEVGGLRLVRASHPVGDETLVYGSPRWSPDGRAIAVERRVPGGPSQIAVLDVQAGVERVVASSDGGRNVRPAWLADGRSLLFASDRGGEAFQVYVVSAEGGEARQVTSVPGGASSPEPSPGGTSLVYVGYTAAGYDLFEMPLDTGRVDQLPTPGAVAAGAGLPPPDIGVSPPNRPVPVVEARYSPVPTLLPHAWSPAADTSDGNVRAGASIGGVDVLGRHAFEVSALWRLQGGSGAVNGPHRARPDWSAFYVYDRWRPSFFAAASQETSFLPFTIRARRAADAELLETSASVGVSLPFLHLRRGQVWQAAFNYERDTLETPVGTRRFHRNALRTSWAFGNAHLFGYSISPERGVTLGVTSEQVRAAFGADGDADAFTADARAYLRIGSRHSVLALRGAAGVASGNARVVRIFYLGGPGPVASPVDFGSDALNLLRGWEDKAFAGTRVGVVNVEYRVPLWRIERGRGTWPLFLRTVHAAFFADAGQAWDRSFRSSDTVGSLGAELALDTIVGFGLPLTVSAGVAGRWTAGAGRLAHPTAYMRIGRAF